MNILNRKLLDLQVFAAVLLDGFKGFHTQIVFYPAGVLLGDLLVHAQGDQQLGDQPVAFKDPFGNLLSAFGQGDEAAAVDVT